MKRIVLLCGHGTSSKLVAQALHSAGFELSIIIARQRRTFQKIKWRAKHLGIIMVLSQMLCAVVARILFHLRGGRKRSNEILNEIGLRAEWPECVSSFHTQGVNDPLTMKILQSLKPDVVVVNGTDIIKREILECIDAPFVNTHCGLTPEYRGVHGAFWALWQGKPENAGVTIHIVDPGIDTGRIVAQARITYDRRKDGLLTFPLLQYKQALPLLLAYLFKGEESGSLLESNVSHQWYHPGIGAYLHLLLAGEIRF